MKIKFYYLLLLILILSSKISLISQETLEGNLELKLKQPVGTEFWLTFMMNFREDPSTPKNALTLELFVTSDNDANVVIECQALNYKEKLFTLAGTEKYGV